MTAKHVRVIGVWNGETVCTGSVVPGLSPPSYSVGAPEAELVLVRDRPIHGSMTLQAEVHPPFGAEAYHVFPFVPARPAASLPEALHAHPQANFDRAVLRGPRRATFRGYPAYFFGADFPADAQTPPTVTANCLVRVGPRYYLIVRQIRLPLLGPERAAELLRRNQQRADTQLRAFLTLFRLEPGAQAHPPARLRPHR